MKFHIQRHLYTPGESSGSCYPTVYACLLDMELDRVPHFNLAYWTNDERKNIEKYYQKRFLEGKPISEFDGPDNQKDNYFNRTHDADRLWDEIREIWLASKGYTEEYIQNIDEWLKDNKDKPYMVSGKSNRGIDHVVIYMNGKLYHDPHPSGEGLVDLHRMPYQYLKKID